MLQFNSPLVPNCVSLAGECVVISRNLNFFLRKISLEYKDRLCKETVRLLDLHSIGGQRATIKAHPATPHHTRPYGRKFSLEGWRVHLCWNCAVFARLCCAC